MFDYGTRRPTSKFDNDRLSLTMLEYYVDYFRLRRAKRSTKFDNVLVLCRWCTATYYVDRQRPWDDHARVRRRCLSMLDHVRLCSTFFKFKYLRVLLRLRRRLPKFDYLRVPLQWWLTKFDGLPALLRRYPTKFDYFLVLNSRRPTTYYADWAQIPSSTTSAMPDYVLRQHTTPVDARSCRLLRRYQAA